MSDNKPAYKGYSLSAKIDSNSYALINQFANLIEKKHLHYDTPMLYEPHITIVRDILADKVAQAESIVKCLSNRKIMALFDSIKVFEVAEYDVLSFSLICPDFVVINSIIVDRLDIVEDYAYQPHVTFAFIKKGLGKELVKNIDFERIKSNQVVIGGYCRSNPKGEYTKLFEVAA